MKAHNYKLSLLGVIVVGLLVVLLVKGVSDNPWASQLSFSAKFTDVRGIREHSNVSYLGLPAGHVAKVEIVNEGDRPLVKTTISITRKNLNIPSDIEVRVTPTLLGEATIALNLPDPPLLRIAPGEGATSSDASTLAVAPRKKVP